MNRQRQILLLSNNVKIWKDLKFFKQIVRTSDWFF